MTTKVRVYPHRVAANSSVIWGNWKIERGGKAVDLESPLMGWDYASTERLAIDVEVDVAQFLAETGLRSLDEIEVIAMADCLQSKIRITAKNQFVARTSTTSVSLVLPPNQLSGSVRLSGHIVLATTIPTSHSLRANLRGARLHSSPALTIALEGEAGRFPTEPVAFSTLGYLRAPWTLVTKFDSLSDNFAGTVRLLINTEHPVGQMALGQATSGRLIPLIRADIFRILVGRVAGASYTDDEIAEPEDGSVSSVLESMCEIFLGRSLASICRLYRDEPGDFEILLQDRLEPLSEISTS